MDEFVPFNYFSFQSSENYDGQYHSMKGVFTAEELATRDDTFRVADEIERKIEQCGEMLTKREFFLEEYDEEGNIKEEYLKDNDGKEHNIELIGFPGFFVKKDIFNKLVRPIRSSNGKYELQNGTIDALIRQSYRGKIPMKLVVHPGTFWGDHYRDLYFEGIDAKEDYIFGVVDIELLCKILQEKGINASVSTLNINFSEQEMRERIHWLVKKYPYPEHAEEFNEGLRQLNEEMDALYPPLEFPSTDQYLNNLNRTQMLSSISITIPFSKFLKERKNNQKIA